MTFRKYLLTMEGALANLKVGAAGANHSLMTFGNYLLATKRAFAGQDVGAPGASHCTNKPLLYQSHPLEQYQDLPNSAVSPTGVFRVYHQVQICFCV